MPSDQPDDHIAEFTLELLRTGSWLFETAADLVEGLKPDAYPGERPEAVVMEMITGTIRTALDDADPSDVMRSLHCSSRRGRESSNTCDARWSSLNVCTARPESGRDECMADACASAGRLGTIRLTAPPASSQTKRARVRLAPRVGAASHSNSGRDQAGRTNPCAIRPISNSAVPVVTTGS